MSSLSLTPVPVLASNAAVYDVPYFNVKDTPYVAKGDGATPDNVAIQAAINAAAAAGGGTVLLPPGTYILNAYLTITSSVNLLGIAATLKLGSSYVNGTQGQGHVFVTASSDVTFDGITFDGNSGTLAASGVNNFAIWATNTDRTQIRVCRFQNVNTGGSTNACIVLSGASDDSKAIGNSFLNCGGGAFFSQGARNLVVGNSVSAVNDVGIVFNGTNARGCTATGNTITGITAQCAFGIEVGASDWTISCNTIRACFGALDLNDATYAGPQVAGGVFSGNEVTDMDKGASSQTITTGVLYRTAWTRNVKILNNEFSGLTPYASNDSFVFVDAASEGLEIRNNTFDSKAQSFSPIVFVNATHTRCIIDGNTIRSTSAVTKLARGIWFQASAILTNTTISNNQFENITNYAVHFDTSVSFTGTLKDNIAISGVGAMYQASPWGTFAPGVIVTPHELRNFGGRSRWNSNAAPSSGAWLSGDIVYNFGPSGAVAGWICTASGSPGTWRALSPKGSTSTQTPGAVTTVTIAHGLGVAPSVYHVQPGDANSRGAPAFFLTVDATNITLNFASALTAATSYTWTWAAG